jgi:hypothetical protein
MAAPPFDINKPDPASVGGWGAEITQTRDNLVNNMMYAAAMNFELPKWNTAFTYGGAGGELTEAIMTYQPDTSIKMKWVITYSGSPAKMADRKWYFDKGLGAGYELLSLGTLTYTYDGTPKLTAIAAT